MEITNNNSIISNGEDSRKIVLPVNVKNRYKAYTTEEWVTLAKEIAPNFDYSKTVYVNKETKVISCQKSPCSLHTIHTFFFNPL